MSFPAVAAEEQDDPNIEPSTGMLFGIEGGAGLSAISAARAESDTISWYEETITTHAAVFWQWQFGRRFQLGLELDGGLWHTVQGNVSTVGGGVIGTVRWPVKSQVAPRFIFMVGPSWIHPPAPREFAIRHAVGWSIGMQNTLGFGIERTNLRRTMRWFCDLRARWVIGYGSEHEMVDTRTGERVSESVDYNSQGGLAVFGVAWHVD